MSHERETGAGRRGHALPEEQQDLLRRAKRLEWISIVVLAITVATVGVVTGQSQAMRAAWLEDLLSFLPPIAFLVATRFIDRPADPEHPYGHHRSIGVAHLVAATALLIMGSFLIYHSVVGLIEGERPPIGIVVIFGHAIWLGWLMIAVMAASGVAPVILGRMKMKLAEPLHDKVLFADADMNKADWSTAVATIVGVLGIGVGLWWMDAVAAIVVAASIVKDGVTNLRGAIGDLTDIRATTLKAKPHPLIAEVERVAGECAWVDIAAARVRDQGHLFHAEVFVVPSTDPTVAQVEALQEKLQNLDWKLHDVIITPSSEIPSYLVP
ncbi:cation diffusion facilitator family transporter [Corynebacterium doosanense]|uniref:Cobalt transporter n=1 Tax=Corynebacterium doosanense CAU 212 = DSM 45436 TaxID=558173 RepID=A0A097IEZ4_9CORY|nr:cation transporter [Corynebacterium doosanense]AIT60693.1 cobalt transporter [Corynebacterium doosanense CAU 212 = DSM 45436]